jgi:hypothetical protein
MTIDTAIDVGYEGCFTLTIVEALKHIRRDAGCHTFGHAVRNPNKERMLYCCRISGPVMCGVYLLTYRDEEYNVISFSVKSTYLIALPLFKLQRQF